MRAILGWLLPAVMLPLTAYAQEATVKEIHDAPAVRGSIIANMLQEHDNPFTLYPYETNYLIYTNTSDMNKEAISSYSWSENARKDEVKFQLSLAFPLWRGILGRNCSSVSPPTIALPVGRSAMSKWAITMTPMVDPTPPHVAGTAFTPG